MTDAAAQLMALGESWAAIAFAVFLRVGAAMALFPAFGERSVPERVRLMLALGFTLVVVPAAEPFVAPAIDGGVRPVTFLLTETLAGLAILVAGAGAVIAIHRLARRTGAA